MAETTIERMARAVARGLKLDPDAISPKAKEAGHEIPEWVFFVPIVYDVIAALRPVPPTEDGMMFNRWLDRVINEIAQGATDLRHES